MSVFFLFFFACVLTVLILRGKPGVSVGFLSNEVTLAYLNVVGNLPVVAGVYVVSQNGLQCW